MAVKRSFQIEIAFLERTEKLSSTLIEHLRLVFFLSTENSKIGRNPGSGLKSRRNLQPWLSPDLDLGIEGLLLWVLLHLWPKVTPLLRWKRFLGNLKQMKIWSGVIKKTRLLEKTRGHPQQLFSGHLVPTLQPWASLFGSAALENRLFRYRVI